MLNRAIFYCKLKPIHQHESKGGTRKCFYKNTHKKNAVTRFFITTLRPAHADHALSAKQRSTSEQVETMISIHITFRRSLAAEQKKHQHVLTTAEDAKVSVKTYSYLLRKWQSPITLATRCAFTGTGDKSPVFPLRCATAQQRQIICAVKPYSPALATFRSIGKARKREAVWIKCELCLYLDKILYLS